MLHAVPELLDALEEKLIEGEDPSALLSSIRWSELVWWPEDLKSALVLKQRIASIQTLLIGLQSPLRATLAGLSGSPSYGRGGLQAEAPALAPRLQEKV
ncbi:hypothetical protein GETHLI_24830 [Geothrix limicola]|uniref:Uncharacterized protein n=1 Tax=Geothrix limicola TaxID=2927978 RepID=A0ABQ5QHF9_9BACT|nr:hypothetical protein [Geothrix limicola]GLH73981.1 hypothetical protein GETHLI_24830 [Geothrix limicola]